MEKIKSRWRKNYLEGDIITNNDDAKDDISDTGGYNGNHENMGESRHHNSSNNHGRSSKHSTPPNYEPLTENHYLDRKKSDHSRSRKDARSMVCDCVLTKEERSRGIMGCLDDCLNRMLMIECGPKCNLGDHCLNKRFQNSQSANVEVFKTRKKGWGLRTKTNLPANSFIMEYVGEVVRSKEFRSRVKKYTKQKIKHHYFMALRSDEIIDATVKGNLTRFINHSCEPNCETQKWTVNGDLRIGFFTLRDLEAGEEVTFDYQFQRYGRKAQKCYCDAPSCRGYIGGNERTFSLNGNASPQPNENKAHKKAYKHGLLLDLTLEDKINALVEDAAEGLKTKDQVIALASLSIKAEEVNDRRKLLDIIRSTKSEISLRLFLDYHGLEILSLWMRDPQADCDFKAVIIDILERLPIPNKTKVIESNVFRMIERWATEEIRSVMQPSSETSNNTNHVVSSDEKITPDDTNEEDKPKESNCTQESVNNEGTPQQPCTPTKEMSTSLPIQTMNSPNIKALANKLLKKFHALSPGFKIPRLNRLQRMEIEKRMDEEVTKNDPANNDKFNFEHKNPFASRNYFKNTNGVTSNAIPKINNLLANKRRYDSLNSNNIDLTPTPKRSKEEHRQQFEFHVRLKDYYDTIEKHYGPAAVEQVKINQRAFTNVNGLHLPYPQSLAYLGTNHPLAPAIPPMIVGPPPVPQPPPQPSPASQQVAATAIAAAAIMTPHVAVPQNQHILYPDVSLDAEARYQQQLVLAQNITSSVDPYHQLNTHLQADGLSDMNMAYQMNGSSYNNTSYQDIYAQPKAPEPDSIVTNQTINDVAMEPQKPEPTNLPRLIVLANDMIEPANAIDDELAFSICDYDEYYSIRDKSLGAEDVTDDSYPYPGSYYTTPNGESWFATITLDRKTQQPRTVILNLHIKPDPEPPVAVSPNMPIVSQEIKSNPIDEPMINDAATATKHPYKAITSQPQALSSTDTNNESPNANNNGDTQPGKIKKKMFEHGVSKYIKDALSEYYKPDCQVARITSKEDFVFLARKLTLAVLEKELNRKGCERLECTKQVKRKVEDFVRIYMAKFGKSYTRYNKA